MNYSKAFIYQRRHYVCWIGVKFYENTNCSFSQKNSFFLLDKEAAPGKRLRFKTTTDASEKQVIDAMQKIASHIKNPLKFSKASKLAIQLIQAGSIKETTSGHFFALLEAGMSSLTSCNEPSLRADYHSLFSAAQDVAEVSIHNSSSYIFLYFLWELE